VIQKGKLVQSFVAVNAILGYINLMQDTCFHYTMKSMNIFAVTAERNPVMIFFRKDLLQEKLGSSNLNIPIHTS